MTDMPNYEHSTISGGGENPANWDNAKISNAFSPLVVDDAMGQSGRYLVIRQLWEQGFETFLRSTQASMSQAWSGPAAEQSQESVQNYIDKQARPVTPALEALSNGIRDAAEAIVNTKNNIGDPLTTEGFKGWLNEQFNEDEISRRTEEARQAMSTHYVNPFTGLDTKIPVIPVPTGPTTSTDIPEPPPGGYPTGTGTPSTTTSGVSNGGGPGGNPSGEGPAVPGEESRTEAPGEDQPGLPMAPGETPPTTAAGTEPAGTTTPTLPAGTSPAGVSTGPGAPGGAPSGMPGAGTPGAPGSPDAPGRSVPGAPGAPGGPQGAPAAGPAAANAAGSRGMGGMPMGGAGRGGGGQENEANRETPDYLINQENTDELLGETPPAVPGGVIGETPT